MSADEEPRPSFWYPTIRDGEFLVCDDEAKTVGWRAQVMVSARILRALLGYQAYPELWRTPAPLDPRGLNLALALIRDARAAKAKADALGLWDEFDNGVQMTTFEHDPEHRDPWWPETLRLYRAADESPIATCYRID